MLRGQMISDTGICTHRSIWEITEVITESAENLYHDVLGEVKNNVTKYAPEIKKCITPKNPADKTLIITFGIGLFGYALVPSKEMLETLGALALVYAGLTPARYAEALEEGKNKPNIVDKLQNKEQ